MVQPPAPLAVPEASGTWKVAAELLGGGDLCEGLIRLGWAFTCWEALSQALISCRCCCQKSPRLREACGVGWTWRSPGYTFLYLLAVSHSLQDLSSPTKDGTRVTAVKAWNPHH